MATINKKIIGTGLNGLIGSRITKLITDYNFENLSLETGVNILDKKIVEERIYKSEAEWVFHFAAKTDVDGCEVDKNKKEEGDAWKINVIGTENVINACQISKKKLLYISTDFVFDGKEKKLYKEEDKPNPINWYGNTKFEAEKRVLSSNTHFIICRPSYPYRAVCKEKKDFFHAILDKLVNSEVITSVFDYVFTPTFIDDIADAIKVLIEKDLKGIYHIVGSKPLSPYQGAVKIAEAFSLDKNLVHKINGDAYFNNRAKRPFHAAINNDKISSLGVKMHSFDEGLSIIKKQMEE